MTGPKTAYQSAIEILDRQKRPLPEGPLTTSADLPLGAPIFRGAPNVRGMREWLEKLGHSHADIDSLNIIHIAGTKGKGSTCAFVESFLRQHGVRVGFPKKTGLYTSPHLMRVNERIRINFDPLNDECFGKYTLDVYNRLFFCDTDTARPGYLQLLALISFHAFLRERVDVAIYETHHGGEYDATNVISCPVVTAITPIGIDHINALGPSIENIAWHKGGIFKPLALAFSAPQEPRVVKVLADRAAEKGLVLQFVKSDDNLPVELEPDVQRLNCSLARKVCDAFLMQKHPGASSRLSHQDILCGAKQFFWPGRFQMIQERDYVWFLDGAHNELSVDKAAAWFAARSNMQRIGSPPTRVLVYAQNSAQRDGEKVLRRFAESLQVPFDYVIFTMVQRRLNKVPESEETAVLEAYTRIWGEVTGARSSWIWNMSAALDRARTIGILPRHILVTGSLYLVGGALSLLESEVATRKI